MAVPVTAGQAAQRTIYVCDGETKIKDMLSSICFYFFFFLRRGGGGGGGLYC